MAVKRGTRTVADRIRDMREEKVKEFGKTTDFGRPAQPVELAPLYVFLASNESRYVTGEVYGATGGRMPY